MDTSSDYKATRVKRGVMSEKTMDGFLTWLARHPLDQIPRDTTGDCYLWKVGSVMVVRHDEKISNVFKKLTTEGFLSAPVMRDGNYFGYIDLFDLVTFAADLFEGETSESWTDFFEKRDDWRSATVGQIIQTTKWMARTPAIDPFQPCLYDSSMLYVFEHMARSGTHRVALLDRKDQLLGIMTESMCISFLRQNMFRLGELKNLKIEKILPDLPKDIVVVKEADTAMQAFKLMAEHHLTGLPIVDDDGVLTGAISTRDLRGVGATGEQFSQLFQSVQAYKRQIRKDFPRQAPRTHYSSKLVPVAGLYVTPQSTIADVIGCMNDGNIHRVFVCDLASANMGKPRVISVITQRDLIMQLLVECGMPPLGTESEE